ncbi:MAG: Crp/Fnr family transcriptional regulator [Sulfuricurvum sp.]|nr:Crp/Fnr family transcriptional regulator [Sulfuricurvum sp.]
MGETSPFVLDFIKCVRVANNYFHKRVQYAKIDLLKDSLHIRLSYENSIPNYLTMIQLLKQVPLFSTLSDDVLMQLTKISTVTSYKKGQILFYEGDEAINLHILINGIVQVYKIDTTGNEILMHRFEPTTMIAEMANLYTFPFPATARFETDGIIIKIDYRSFEHEFLKNPLISFEFIRSLSQKIKHLEHVIHTQIILNASGKTAKFLIDYEADFNQWKRHEIAKMLNMNPVTLSRVLKKFQTFGYINTLAGKITIQDKDKLRQLYASY